MYLYIYVGIGTNKYIYIYVYIKFTETSHHNNSAQNRWMLYKVYFGFKLPFRNVQISEIDKVRYV